MNFCNPTISQEYSLAKGSLLTISLEIFRERKFEWDPLKYLAHLCIKFRYCEKAENFEKISHFFFEIT